MKIYKLFSNFKMNIHHGGLLPIYLGRQYQQWWNSQFYCTLCVTYSKIIFTETVKAAPKVIDYIVNENASWHKNRRCKYCLRYI